MKENYPVSIEIVSRHRDFDGQTLRKYYVEGIETVGVYGEEPFEIHIKNNIDEALQIRCSLDGSDILTGKPADLEINHNMWLVRAGKTLHLKAWAENNQGGARFVFTSADKGVSLNAHGDVSHKGIISAAVFTERDKPMPKDRSYGALMGSGNISLGRRFKSSGDVMKGGGQRVNSYNGRSDGSMSFNENAPGPAAAASSPISEYDSMDMELDLKRDVAVGAGEYVAQPTHTVKGLENPVLNTIVRVRYVWYDRLKELLAEANYEDKFPTGFPAQKIKTFADLSDVPRTQSSAARTEVIKSTETIVRKEQVFDRFV